MCVNTHTTFNDNGRELEMENEIEAKQRISVDYVSVSMKMCEQFKQKTINLLHM